MKKIAVFILATLFLSSQVLAADLKIAVIDMNQVLQRSPLMLDMNAKLAEKFTPRQDELNQAKRQLQEVSDQLTLKGDSMSPDDKNNLQNRIITDKANVATLQANLERDLIIAKNEDLQAFTLKFNSVIKKIASDEGYDIIEQRNSIIYLNEKLDITEKVIKLITVDPDKSAPSA